MGEHIYMHVTVRKVHLKLFCAPELQRLYNFNQYHRELSSPGANSNRWWDSKTESSLGQTFREVKETDDLNALLNFWILYVSL